MANITTKIAGVFKFPEAKEHMKAMIEGSPFEFKREPDNPFDANAILLFAAHEVKAGYVPKIHAAQLQNCEIESIVKGASWDAIVITYLEKKQ